MEKPTVLIVEDNRINALVLRKAIDKYCSCVMAVNDNETFQAMKDHNFDIILMDINLGGNSLDGEAIMKIIRQQPQFNSTRIFAVTSYAMPGDEQRFLNAGFDLYFSKPIDKNMILNGILATIAPGT